MTFDNNLKNKAKYFSDSLIRGDNVKKFSNRSDFYNETIDLGGGYIEN